jgi:hypothetical protein
MVVVCTPFPPTPFEKAEPPPPIPPVLLLEWLGLLPPEKRNCPIQLALLPPNPISVPVAGVNPPSASTKSELGVGKVRLKIELPPLLPGALNTPTPPAPTTI